MRFFITCFMFCFLFSCNYIASKKKNNSPKLNALIDFTKVDSSPYFNECSNLVNKKRTSCFEQNLRVKVSAIFKNYSDNVSEEFDEEFIIFLKINKKGVFSIDSIHKSNEFTDLVSDFNSNLKKSIRKFPKVYPALKRGIPVSVQYKLPIHIISN